MGGASSKVSRSAAGAAKRQYPQRVPPAPAPAQSKGPTTHPAPQAHESRSSAVESDAQDAEFAASLRSIGPVQPNPSFSPSSTAFRNPHDMIQVPTTKASESGGQQQQHQAVFPNPATNPALRVLEARTRIAQEAEEEEQKLQQTRDGANTRRKFADVITIRRILQMRDAQGLQPREIEDRLGLREGTVEKLGPKGVVGQTAL